MQGDQEKPDTMFQPRKNITDSETYLNMPRRSYISQVFSFLYKREPSWGSTGQDSFLRMEPDFGFLPSKKGNASAGTSEKVLSNECNETIVLSKQKLHLLETSF